jgi:hypothetical protein
VDIKEAEVAYTAGWFDSRGFARVSCTKGRTPTLLICIRTAESGLTWLKDRWGGTSHMTSGSVSKHSKIQYPGYTSWVVKKLEARRFLLDISPYLQLRRPLAEKCVNFITRVVDDGERSNPDLNVLVESIRKWRVPL